MNNLATIDLFVIVFYLVGIVGLGLWIVRRQRMNTETYFLAGCQGFDDGLVWGNFEWMAVFALIVLGLVFAPFYYKNKVATLPEFLGKRYISPPISAVFFWGVFWRRGNHQGAIATFAGGFLLGLTAFLVDFPIFGDTKIISDGWGISFMMQAWWLFVASSVIFIGTSLISPPPDYEKIESVTLRSPLAFLNREEGEDRNIPLIISGVLAGIMILLYLIF